MASNLIEIPRAVFDVLTIDPAKAGGVSAEAWPGIREELGRLGFRIEDVDRARFEGRPT